MKLSPFPALLLLATGALPTCALAAEDPLAPARKGQVSCYQPNAAAKTCRAINSYRFEGGKIVGLSQTSLTEAVVMQRTAPVVVRDGAVCGTVRAEDIDTAAFLVRGQPATAEQTTALRDEVKRQYASLMGRELCTRFSGVGPVLTAAVAIDGQPQPDIKDTMMWVDPKAGFKVAP